MPPADLVLIANRTARGAGAIGEAAAVPALVRRWARPGMALLDFGAGPEARHTLALRQLGLSVTAHDFGQNTRPGLHDPEALDRSYDLVFASNVLNVQGNLAMLRCTLDQIAAATASAGAAILNLPASPRKGAWPESQAEGDALLHRELQSRFAVVQRLPSRLWACRRPHATPLAG